MAMSASGSAPFWIASATAARLSSGRFCLRTAASPFLSASMKRWREKLGEKRTLFWMPMHGRSERALTYCLIMRRSAPAPRRRSISVSCLGLSESMAGCPLSRFGRGVRAAHSSCSASSSCSSSSRSSAECCCFSSADLLTSWSLVTSSFATRSWSCASLCCRRSSSTSPSFAMKDSTIARTPPGTSFASWRRCSSSANSSPWTVSSSSSSVTRLRRRSFSREKRVLASTTSRVARSDSSCTRTRRSSSWRKRRLSCSRPSAALRKVSESPVQRHASRRPRSTQWSDTWRHASYAQLLMTECRSRRCSKSSAKARSKARSNDPWSNPPDVEAHASRACASARSSAAAYACERRASR
mmetsp:Transcript_13771/g.45299  ORF Transcript_13771/g.45299 Transcript_13771/m.45299 type:complete len:356 (-) Transcript_13771:114-1181(-)